MKTEAEQVLCRVQLSNFTRRGGLLLYEWIVETAHRMGLQGATVLEGIYGMGCDGTIMQEHSWAIPQERPIVVEIVDEVPRIEALLARVEPVFTCGVITLERAHVWLYRHASRESRSEAGGQQVLTSQAASAAMGVRTMKIPEDGVLLRIFIGESDQEPGHHRPLFEAIVRKAREAHLAGATVLRGPMGFGRHSRVHTARFLDLSTDLPIVIEIVDAADRIDAFLPVIDELVTEGLVTLEAVRVLKYVSTERR